MCRPCNQILLLHRPVKALKLIRALVCLLRGRIFIPDERDLEREAEMSYFVFLVETRNTNPGVDLRFPHDNVVFASGLVDLAMHLVF